MTGGLTDESRAVACGSPVYDRFVVNVGDAIPTLLRDAVLTSKDGVRTTFGEIARRGPMLAVFIRHFGCIGCAEQIESITPRLAEIAALGVHALVIGNGPADHIEAFVERHGLSDKPVDVVTDPSLVAFDAAGLGRSMWATMGPLAVVDFLRALTHGQRARRTDGDLLQQGGAFLIDRGVVVWAHRNASLGGHADAADLIDAVLCLGGRRAPALL